MTKKEIRAIYKEKRAELSIQKLEKGNDLILIHFQKIQLPFLDCVHTYLPSLKLWEVDTANIIRYLQFKNPEIKIAVPVIDIANLSMQHYSLDENSNLITNSFGIEEPSSGNKIETEEIDLVLVPLLAFDTNGFRVGYGKGFYDRFLKECKPDVIKIGLSFFEPTGTITDTDQYDVPLDYCVTTEGVYSFNTKK